MSSSLDWKGFARETSVARWCQARFKSSLLFEAYLHTIHREWLQERTEEIAFYKALLGAVGKYGSIFDIGANIGNKAEVFVNVAPRVYCVEPDPTTVAYLKQRYGRRPGVTVIESAASHQAGTIDLLGFDGRSSLNTVSLKWAQALANSRFGTEIIASASRTVRATTLDELIDTHGVPLYIKIDVEGHELEVLRGLSRPVSFLSFEVNLPEFRSEALACVAHLTSLRPGTLFNYIVSPRALRLEMDRWLSAKEFTDWLECADEPSFEVFATSPG